MITTDGKRLMNSVLANRDIKVGTHIALGLNIVSDATLDGSSFPYTHNKYHSPYILDEVPIVNVGIIDGIPDQIVFAGQASTTKHFIANNIALISKRFAGEIDEQSTIVPVDSPQWNAVNITIPSDVKDFTEHGYLLLDSVVNTHRVFSEGVPLYGKALTDIIAFPFTIHGITDPTDILITLKFTHHDLEGTVGTSEHTKTIVAVPPTGFMIEGDSPYNVVTQLVDPTNPLSRVPFVWQTRIQNFSNASTLLANGNGITETEISISSGTGAYQVACGSIKFTPDNISSFYRVTTAYRKLLRVLYKTNEQAYVNAEYRILGV
jgi:hypothetical protein